MKKKNGAFGLRGPLHECMLSCFSHVRLFVTLWTIYSLPGSSVHGILQVRKLEWDAMPYSRVSFLA